MLPSKDPAEREQGFDKVREISKLESGGVPSFREEVSSPVDNVFMQIHICHLLSARSAGWSSTYCPSLLPLSSLAQQQ